jgi:hypothetical protein
MLVLQRAKQMQEVKENVKLRVEYVYLESECICIYHVVGGINVLWVLHIFAENPSQKSSEGSFIWCV